jgi:PAS domain S-box-containing protein
MSLNLKIYSLLSGFLMVIFFITKTATTLGLLPCSETTNLVEFTCFLLFIPLFYLIINIILSKQKENLNYSKYSNRLNEVLNSQSHNELFYRGDVKEGGKTLTKEVTNTIETDRCSIWLYNQNKTSIICQQLYVKSEDKWYDNIELFENDFKPYFDYLKIDPIIVANNAETHDATSCFTDGYLKPLGIKSMLDVPIIHKGKIIGVICIESLTLRKWDRIEINFAQLLSSLYSFAYSVKEINKLTKEMIEFDNFVDNSVLISKTDLNGKITYVNKKFEEVSGWKLNEVLGKDHNILNSGEHTKELWSDMYDTIINKKQIWNSIITNKTKKGDLYWVDSYIKSNFDEYGKLNGFISIRYDISDVVKKSKELEKKNTYLEHAAKIIRHDMHSGINTYIPRGISSLERRLTEEDISNLKLESPLKMCKEGLKHAQKVYRGVYEFTNLVKKDRVLEKNLCNLKEILKDYLSSTSYYSQVILDDNLPSLEVNESLFCTAIDNLIRNGLKYNDSDTKVVSIYSESERKKFGLRKRFIVIQDNGRGMSQEEFNKLSKPYVRKEGQKERGTGLGLNICIAILEEHGFEISCDKNEIGTKMKIKLK